MNASVYVKTSPRQDGGQVGQSEKGKTGVLQAEQSLPGVL
jgi:hypothetical protein